MSTSDSESLLRSNKEFLSALSGPLARFYPIDFHVHSLGSFDTCQSGKFERLPDSLQTVAKLINSPPPDPGRYDKDLASPANVEAFFRCLCKRRDEIASDQGLSETNRWACVGITDHNTAYFATALSSFAWEKRSIDQLIVLPGMELEVHFTYPECEEHCKVHILLHFAPCTAESSIRLAICAAADDIAWDFGKSITVKELPQFIHNLRTSANYPCICIAAHVWSQKGLGSEPQKLYLNRLDAEIARSKGELERARGNNLVGETQELEARLRDLREKRDDKEAIHLDVLSLIGHCGFDALHVRDQSQEQHYRRLHRFRELHGRAVPIVCSDAHCPDSVFSCNGSTPYAKLSISLSRASEQNLFIELRDRVFRFGETRLTYCAPGSVSYWIEGIEVFPDNEESRRFWINKPGDHFHVSLSRNLNCLVGGRGSGKSAAIEALAFVCAPSGFSDEAAKNDKDQAEWYKRAAATLAGCRIRVVWKSTAEDGIGQLKKRAIFATRYFDREGHHGTVELRDLEGEPVVDGTKQPVVRLLRAHDIELTAKPENLRQLFDELCGPEKVELDTQINQIHAFLAKQRSEIVSLVDQLAEITDEGNPLRQFGIRKLQFDKVDAVEHRAKYQQVDTAAETHGDIAAIQSDWTELEIASKVDEIKLDVVNFLDTSNARLLDAERQTKPGREVIQRIISPIEAD